MHDYVTDLHAAGQPLLFMKNQLADNGESGRRAKRVG